MNRDWFKGKVLDEPTMPVGFWTLLKARGWLQPADVNNFSHQTLLLPPRPDGLRHIVSERDKHGRATRTLPANATNLAESSYFNPLFLLALAYCWSAVADLIWVEGSDNRLCAEWEQMTRLWCALPMQARADDSKAHKHIFFLSPSRLWHILSHLYQTV